MRALILTVSLLSFAPVALAQEAPSLPDATVPRAERPAIALLLSSAHELPPRAQFEARASDAWAVLHDIAGGRGPIAERAVEAMFLWPTDRTFAFAAKLLEDDATPRARRNRVLLLTARTFADRSTALVVNHLSHADAQVRITAAAACAHLKSAEVKTALADAIEAEVDQAVANEMLRRSALTP